MIVWCLFDGSGIAGLPWAQTGHIVYCFNADSADHGEYQIKMQHENLHYVNCWIDNSFLQKSTSFDPPEFIIAFPSCTNLAQCGEQHERQNDDIKNDVETAKIAEKLGSMYNCPWMVENPVGKLSTEWRKPDYYFHPYEYGEHLSADEGSYHPKMPVRDGYTKKTCIWAGNGFVMPEKRPVAHCGFFWGWKALGGNSTKTKQLRSLTPRGFARAVFQANSTTEFD